MDFLAQVVNRSDIGTMKQAQARQQLRWKQWSEGTPFDIKAGCLSTAVGITFANGVVNTLLASWADVFNSTFQWGHAHCIVSADSIQPTQWQAEAS